MIIITLYHEFMLVMCAIQCMVVNIFVYFLSPSLYSKLAILFYGGFRLISIGNIVIRFNGGIKFLVKLLE